MKRLTLYFYRLLSRMKHSPSEATETEADFSLNMMETENYERGEFFNSLEQLSKEDIPLSCTVVKTRSIAEILRLCMLYISAIVFIVSCVMLIQNILYRQKGNAIYDQLEHEFFGDEFDFSSGMDAADGDSGPLRSDKGNASISTMTDAIEKISKGESITIEPQQPHEQELQKMIAKLQALARKNEDIYGWIYVEGTNINYPIVQGDDNDYYLEHAFTGDYLPIGSIFADYRNNRSINRNYNTVFYGHNITSGTMFHDVTKFFDDYYFNNVLITIYTFDGIFVYEPFAVYETRYDSNYIKTGFTSYEDFVAFTDKIKGEAKKIKDLEFTTADRIITLSTCTNGAMTQRYALHAKLLYYIVD